MIKAVIFDLDGLLIDSEHVWNIVTEHLLEKYNVIHDKNVFNLVRGMGLREAIVLYTGKMGLKADPKKLMEEFRRLFCQISGEKGELKLLDGARDLLKIAKDANLKIGLATGGHSQAGVETILHKVNLRNLFDEIISSNDVKRGKPDPDVYLITAEKFGLRPKECLALEDSANGVLAGKAAGMKVFGVNKDEKIKKELKKVGADKVFSSLLEIKSL